MNYVNAGKEYDGPFGTPTPEGGIRNGLSSNTHVPPHPPVLKSKTFADGREDSWLEYIPEKLAERPALIISCHGGGAQAMMQFEETSWCYIAESEGAVAVFPNAGGQRRSWLTEDSEQIGERPSMLEVFTKSPDGRADEDTHHIKFIRGLIDEMKAKYNIDPGRVYMQGMSMGDIMTMMFARVCGDLLAGAASTAGPSPEIALFDENDQVKGYKCPVPVYQARGELDAIVIAQKEGREITTRQDVNASNREFWLRINECGKYPRLAILDVNNLAFYTGNKANVVFRDVKHRTHGQTLDDAQWAWHTLFKNTRRNPDGTISCCDTELSARGDVDAAALCDGCGYAYINNSRVKLSAPAYARWQKSMNFAAHTQDDYKLELYAPLSFLSLYFGAAVELTQGGRAAVIHAPGGDCQIAEASVGCLQNGFLRSMFMPVEIRNGELYVPVRWFAENIFGKHTTQCGGALYISDHHGEMTKDMERLIKDILS